KGRVEQFGTPMELYHHPATKFVATFIGQPNMNLLPAKVTGKETGGLIVAFDDGHTMTLPVDTSTAQIGDTVDIGIRPENAQLGAGMPMRVRVLERLGGVAITYSVMPNGQRFCASLPGDAAIAEGDTINITVNPADCHVFAADGTVMRRKNAPALAA
ncbi:MAG: TOBE domain-containing protein, partial [Paracoccaceae bacterium]